MVHTNHIGGTLAASDIEVANIGHGLMLMTWCPNPVSDEQAFEAIKDGVDAAGGVKILLNSGVFYVQQLSVTNLELLARFYKKYPEYVHKTVLCVKGGVVLGGFRPVATEENITRSIDNINAKLEGTKCVDIFENARVDTTRPIEETIGITKKLIQEGKFNHIGMSECNSETLRRANAVHPIASVEIEISPWSYEEETKKVIATAAELGISILAYSPLGRGFLTGQIKKFEDIPEDDMRRHFDRFQPVNFGHNLQLVERLTAIARKRGVTPGQLSLSWVMSLGPHIIPIPGSSKSTRTLDNLAASDITLTAEDISGINEVLASFEVKGERYAKGTPHLWS